MGCCAGSKIGLFPKILLYALSRSLELAPDLNECLI